MKVLVGVTRIFVGIFFIISGFIKLSDPLGFSYKLQEYFSEGVLNLEFLQPYALLLSVILVITEVLLGVMLIIGYKRKLTLISLLAMIVFFTFLTFYSAYFNKVTDCGCFGDAMPMNPWQSFWKDVALLILIVILFIGKRFITPFFSKFVNIIITFLVLIASMWYSYHVLMHLPSIDFRAYKKGVNITEGMSVPDGAPVAKFEYQWKFEENGVEKVIPTSGNYPKTSGKFIGVETIEVEKGYEPPIHDFAIEKDGEDYTQQFLEADKVLAIICYNLSKSEAKGLERLKALADRAIGKGYQVIALSASSEDDKKVIKEKYQLPFDFYTTDETALKTMLRSNPGAVQLQKGTILDKAHWNDFDEIKF